MMSCQVPGLKPATEEEGNLTDISKAGSLHQFLTGLHKQFGPIASFWWGKMYTVSIASADLFEEVAHVFDRPPEPFANFEPVFETKCIQYANKEEGQQRRKHYNKVLSEEAMKKNFPQLQEVANELSERWTKMINGPKIPLTQYTSLYALKAIVHTLYGNIMKDDSKEELDLRSDTDEVWGEVEISLVKPRTKEREEHMQEGQKDLIELIKTMIRDRKANPPKQGEETLLDMIINYSNYEDLQHADALQFTTGGQYTVEYMLACVIYYVATHPDVDKKLYEEIKTVLGDRKVDGINMKDLIYLRQVLDETLRCSLVATWAARVQETDTTIGGYYIPKSTPVIAAVGIALKDEKAWPNPDKFDPDRFSKENAQKRSQFWFSPFGFGVRQCQSHHFTYAAATVFMVTLLRKFRFHLTDKSQVMKLVYGLATHPKEEIFISLTAR